MRVTVQGTKRVSMAALICTKTGRRQRLVYCIHLDRGPAKGRRKGFTETDYARLLDAAHQQLGGPVVPVWDNCETHDGRSVHQPRLRPRSEAEIAFVGIGPGAGRRLKAARPAGAVRIRAKMARAVEPATVLGNDRVDQALGLAATAGRFADDDLLSILGHIADSKPVGEVVRADEARPVQNGTVGWQVLGQPPHVPRELTAG